MPQIRLQKILAEAGLGSRRKCERLIEEGRVSVNGKTVQSLGSKADPAVDDIRFNNARLRAQRKVYLLVNKPRGYICSSAGEGKKRVVDLVDDRIAQRVVPVGRLDVASEGLIILTNDGELANHLTHPRYGVEKTYLAKVEGRVDERALAKLSRGVHLPEGRSGAIPATISRREGDLTWIEMRLREGKNREIRRILARLGYRVKRLKRTRIGKIVDSSLKPGDSRHLTPTEVAALWKSGQPHAKPPRTQRRGVKGENRNPK